MTGVQQQSDLDVFKDIPGYRAILKAVLKNQIQILVEQLSTQTGEESVILTASVNDGTLSHLGSEFGKVFLQDHEEIKTQFLGFCIKSYHKRKTPEYLPQTKRFAAAKRHSPDFSRSQDSSSDTLYTGTPEVSCEDSTIHPVILSKSISKSRNLDSISHVDHHKSPAGSSKKREVSKSRNLHSVSNLNHQALPSSSQTQNSFQSEEPLDSLGSSFVEKDLQIPRQSADLNHSIYNKNVPIIVKTEAVDYEELSQEPAEMVVEDFRKQTAESLSETLGSETVSDKLNVNIKLEKDDDLEIIGEDMLETSSQCGEYPYSSSDSQPNFGNMSGAEGMGLGADGQQYNVNLSQAGLIHSGTRGGQMQLCEFIPTPNMPGDCEGVIVTRGGSRFEKMIKCEMCGNVYRTSNMARHKRKYCKAIHGNTRSRNWETPKNQSF